MIEWSDKLRDTAPWAPWRPIEGKNRHDRHAPQDRLPISGSAIRQPLRGVKRPETDRRGPETVFLSIVETVSTFRCDCQLRNSSVVRLKTTKRFEGRL